MRTWLHSGHTGCFFAKTFAQGEGTKKPLLAVTAAQRVTSGLNTFFDNCAAESVPGLAIFPAVQTVDDLVHLLEQLHQLARWSCSTPSVPSFTRSAELVRVLWQTPDPDWRSEAMGLAPLVTMPITRRSPHTCLALWPGKPSNSRRFKRAEDGVLDFLDTQHQLPDAAHQQIMKKSQDATGELMKSPTDDVRHYRHVAFVLPRGSCGTRW